MEQMMEFAANHPWLAGGFAAVVVLIIYTEIARRFQAYTELGTTAAVQLINRHNATVIDVSAVADFNKGHIADARNITLSQLDNASKEISKLADRPLLVVCKNGQSAPGAASRLVKMGCENVSVLKGGMAQWQADNYPVTRN